MRIVSGWLERLFHQAPSIHQTPYTPINTFYTKQLFHQRPSTHNFFTRDLLHQRQSFCQRYVKPTFFLTTDGVYNTHLRIPKTPPWNHHHRRRHHHHEQHQNINIHRTPRTPSQWRGWFHRWKDVRFPITSAASEIKSCFMVIADANAQGTSYLERLGYSKWSLGTICKGTTSTHRIHVWYIPYRYTYIFVHFHVKCI